MKFRALSIAQLLSLSIAIVVFIVLLTSVFVNLKRYNEVLLNNSIYDIKIQVAKLSRLAERTISIDPQILFEEISNTATDARVGFAAVVKSNNMIMYSTDYAKQNQPFNNIPVYYNQDLFNTAKEIKNIHINISGDLILAYMSFYELSGKDEVRSTNKGLIVLSYNLASSRGENFEHVFEEVFVDLFISLIIVLIVVYVLRKYVAKPVEKLSQAANSIITGNYNTHLEPVGPREIQDLTSSFSVMSDSLKAFITDIQESIQHTETIIENVIDGVITIDVKGKILSFNKSAEEIFLYKASEVIGLNVNVLMPEPYRSGYDGFLSAYLETGHKKVIGIGREVQGIRKNGEIFPLDLGVSEIERNNERLFIGIIRDLTEKFKIDKVKRDFVSTVSHELRTPLTAIRGAISLVSSGALGSVSEQAQELLLNAARNSERLNLLINDLLDMEKILEGKLELNIQKYEIQSLLNDAIDYNKSYAEKFAVKIQKVGVTESVTVSVDNIRFQQVLSNLISNACKFSKENSNVEIGVKKLENSSIRIFVSDHGIGIPDTFKSQIFEKFSQVDATDTKHKGGTGLGLAISKELVELMSGKIGFDSEESKGSTFYIDLPIAGEI